MRVGFEDQSLRQGASPDRCAGEAAGADVGLGILPRSDGPAPNPRGTRRLITVATVGAGELDAQKLPRVTPQFKVSAGRNARSVKSPQPTSYARGEEVRSPTGAEAAR